MDLGGASTQITFETASPAEDPANEVRLRLYGQHYCVYTHSFLCYGRDQVLRRLLAGALQVPHHPWPTCTAVPSWREGGEKRWELRVQSRAWTEEGSSGNRNQSWVVISWQDRCGGILPEIGRASCRERVCQYV